MTTRQFQRFQNHQRSLCWDSVQLVWPFVLFADLKLPFDCPPLFIVNFLERLFQRTEVFDKVGNLLSGHVSHKQVGHQ